MLIANGDKGGLTISKIVNHYTLFAALYCFTSTTTFSVLGTLAAGTFGANYLLRLKATKQKLASRTKSISDLKLSLKALKLTN